MSEGVKRYDPVIDKGDHDGPSEWVATVAESPGGMLVYHCDYESLRKSHAALIAVNATLHQEIADLRGRHEGTLYQRNAYLAEKEVRRDG